MALAELIHPFIARYKSAGELSAGITQYISQGAIGVVPKVSLKPMSIVEVWIALGDEPLVRRGIPCQVVLLQPQIAVLRMEPQDPELIAELRAASAVIAARGAGRKSTVPAPITLDGFAPLPDFPGSDPFVVPNTDAGIFSEPSFEELVPVSAAEAAPAAIPTRPRFNIDSRHLLFDDVTQARRVMGELRDNFAVWGDCLRIPSPGPATVTFEIDGRVGEGVEANLFPGPKGGVVIQPSVLEKAMAALEGILEAPASELWSVAGSRPITLLASPAEFLTQPMLTQPTAEQMAAPTLALLLRALIKFPATRRVRFSADGNTCGEFFTEGQRAQSALELDALMRAAQQGNLVEVTELPHVPGLPVSASLTNVLGATLRRQLDRFDVGALAAGFGARASGRPTPTDRAARLLDAFAAPPPYRREFARLARHKGDVTSFTEGSTRFSWEVIYLLELNGALDWA